MASMEPKDDSMVALVVVEHEDSQGCRQSNKIRVRRSDLAADGKLTVEILNRLLLDRCGTISDGSVELLDVNDNTFCSLLEHTEWNKCDLVQSIGTRLRARIQRVHNSDQEQRLAIQGRFYPYNGSLEIAGTSIQVDEQLNTPEEGTAGNVWDGALMLAMYLDRRSELVKSKRILELGSGCGLVGIAAGICGAKEVILTDLSHALPLISENIDRHRVQSNAAGCEQMTCKPCDWFCPLPEELLRWQPQVLLVADCVWMQELVAPLLATIRQFIERAAPADVPVIISYQRRGKSTHEEFWVGIHSLFRHVQEIDVSSVGLEASPVLFLLECRR